jgi:hypothetical protein
LARAGWKGFDSEVEVEAVKVVLYRRPMQVVLYRRPMLRAAQLSSGCTSAAKERDYDVMCSIDGVQIIFKKQYASNL